MFAYLPDVRKEGRFEEGINSGEVRQFSPGESAGHIFILNRLSRIQAEHMSSLKLLFQSLISEFVLISLCNLSLELLAALLFSF
ncbi:hypothetical protein RSJ42_17805 [Methanosarcina hadiensis]|uniref:hypothetical protein n=1 Tax=Methanosarcina hadiensis TaxID=3078083 RepID=UPI003977CE42